MRRVARWIRSGPLCLCVLVGSDPDAFALQLYAISGVHVCSARLYCVYSNQYTHELALPRPCTLAAGTRLERTNLESAVPR